MNENRYNHSLTAEELKLLTPEAQREIMMNWFAARYEDPVHRTPYDSSEGGYIWIYGGPFDAEEELRGEFEGIVDDKIIEDLAESLSHECSDWTNTQSEDDYDQDLLDVVGPNANALPTLLEALETVSRLVQLKADLPDSEALNRVLFANAISALESFLSDSFINRVLTDPAALRKFFESSQEFKQRAIPYSDIYKAAEAAREDAKKHLLKVIWHNVGKVVGMYKETLGVDFGNNLAEVAKAIPKRHDIVHRNGKDKDGKLVQIAKDDVLKLVSAVKDMAQHINKQLDSKNVDLGLDTNF
jgi:hypothetical protein